MVPEEQLRRVEASVSGEIVPWLLCACGITLLEPLESVLTDRIGERPRSGCFDEPAFGSTLRSFEQLGVGSFGVSDLDSLGVDGGVSLHVFVASISAAI